MPRERESERVRERERCAVVQGVAALQGGWSRHPLTSRPRRCLHWKMAMRNQTTIDGDPDSAARLRRTNQCMTGWFLVIRRQAAAVRHRPLGQPRADPRPPQAALVLPVLLRRPRRGRSALADEDGRGSSRAARWQRHSPPHVCRRQPPPGLRRRLRARRRLVRLRFHRRGQPTSLAQGLACPRERRRRPVQPARRALPRRAGAGLLGPSGEPGGGGRAGAGVGGGGLAPRAVVRGRGEELKCGMRPAPMWCVESRSAFLLVPSPRIRVGRRGVPPLCLRFRLADLRFSRVSCGFV